MDFAHLITESVVVNLSQLEEIRLLVHPADETIRENKHGTNENREAMRL